MKIKLPFIALTLHLFTVAIAFSQTVPYTIGRIAVSSDGNMHDDDDWGASAATLAIIASQSLQDKLTLYVYNDHIWGSQNDDEEEMELSVVETSSRFGFHNTNLISAVDDPTAAYHAMRDVILSSSANDPLTIIAAGPMEVTGRGLALAKDVDASKLQHVRVISHSVWNNRHSDLSIGNRSKSDFEDTHNGWTWGEMETEFRGDGVVFDQIADQNNDRSQTVGFATTKAGPSGGRYWDAWNFIRDYSAHSDSVNSAIHYCYSRLRAVKRPDLSDSGMAYYLFTGDEQGGPAGLEAMFDNGFAIEPSASITFTAIADFPVLNMGQIPFTVDNRNNALSINAGNVNRRNKYARASTVFTGTSGVYSPSLTALGETDGESSYRLWVDGVLIDTVTNEVTATDYVLQVHRFPSVTLTDSSSIWVESIAVSNGLIPEGDGFAYSRGRWRELSFVPQISGGFTVSAGVDRSLELPDSSVLIDGAVTGAVDDVLWRQVSGPNTATLVDPLNENLEVRELVAGIYIFELRATVGTQIKTDLMSISITTGASEIWRESGGIVIMEAENTVSDFDLWEEKTTYRTHTGTGYLEFTGNQPTSGALKSPVCYEFMIERGGLYYLHLHCAKKAQEVNGTFRGDVANDCFVKVMGDYTASPNAGGDHRDDALLFLLRRDTKFFGGDQKKFGWYPSANLNAQLDPGGEDNKRVAVYNFKSGEVYKFVMSGRSRDFSVDRIMFRHIETSFDAASALTQPESERGGSELTAEAGEDQMVILPTNDLVLDGSIMSDSAVSSIEWRQTSGPTATLNGAGAEDLELSDLVVGVYVFTLTVSNSSGETDSDSVTVTVSNAPTSMVLFSTEDSYVSGERNAGRNFGSGTTLLCKTDAASERFTRFSYLRFDLGDLSGSLPIQSAILRLKVDENPGSTVGHELKFVSDDSWEESTITWDNAPDGSVTLGGIVVPPASGEWIEFDVSSQLLAELNGDQAISFMLEAKDRSLVAYHSKEAEEGDRPELVINFAEFGYSKFSENFELIGGPADDDDNDGYSNFYEYALRGSPKNSTDQGFRPMVEFDADGNMYFSSVELIDGAFSDVRYTIQMNADLSPDSWEVLPDNGRVTVPLDGTSEYEEVQYMLPITEDLERRMFLRVLVEGDL